MMNIKDYFFQIKNALIMDSIRFSVLQEINRNNSKLNVNLYKIWFENT